MVSHCAVRYHLLQDHIISSTLQIHRKTKLRLLKHASLKLFTAREKVITFFTNTFVYDSDVVRTSHNTKPKVTFFENKCFQVSISSKMCQAYTQRQYACSVYNAQETGRGLLFKE